MRIERSPRRLHCMSEPALVLSFPARAPVPEDAQGALPQVSSRELQAFLAVARVLSFSKAAALLYLDPSTVSKLVTRLEKELGVQLLKRSTRRVQLTGAGRAALEPTRRMLATLQELAVASRVGDV
jgi:DNA-binding MarR family transcriptional regulator